MTERTNGSTGDGIVVDSCRPEDIDAVVDLLGVLFEQEADFSADPERQRHALHRILGEPERGVVLVARHQDRLIGSVMLLRSVSTALGEEVCWLEDLVVQPDSRGRGAGHALVEAAIAEARARGWARITLLTDHDNLGAQSLYQRHGFEPSRMVVLRLRS